MSWWMQALSPALRASVFTVRMLSEQQAECVAGVCWAGWGTPLVLCRGSAILVDSNHGDVGIKTLQ
jgi:hypothetical protein